MKKKILHVSCEGLGNGGVQAVIMGIVRTLKGDMYFDILLFTNEVRYYDHEFQTYGKVFRIPNYNGKSKYRKKIDYYIRFFRIFNGTYKILKEHGPYDAIHCHNDFESGICSLAAYFAGVKVRIVHAHTADKKISKNIIGYAYKKSLQRLMNFSSNIKLSCTQQSLVSVFGKQYLKNKNSFIIPNGIDLTRFKKTVSNTELKSKINIVHVGRYCKNKNQMLLIEILPYILQMCTNAKLQLIGFGEEYKNQLQNKAKSLGIESRVEFLSSDSNVKEVLNKSSLFIFPSINEGFGIALLEAQAMEVPCLVSDSIPKEVDCGLCKFLSLSEIKEVWATEAVNIIRDKHSLKLNETKIRSLDMKVYANKIKSIYMGGIV